MAIYFISDVHLGVGSREEEKAKEDRLLKFLEHVRPSAEGLFIVGDLFDFWFEYATVIPKGFHRTLAALQHYTDDKIPVRYLVGNHDCWMGDFFETELGVTIHRRPFEITLQGKRVFLHHGDGLAEKDLGYRMVKPILRSPLAIGMYRWLHPDIGVRLARGTSRSSRGYTAQKHYGSEEGMLRYAEELIAGGVDIVVMGHHHKPSRVQIGTGTYANLGDWIVYNTYGEMVNGTIALKEWEGT